MLRQRDIVDVRFDINGDFLQHPVIVLSNNDAIQLEEYFVGIMLTSTGADDEFSFLLGDYMLNTPMSKSTQARLHLLGWFRLEDVIPTPHNNFIKITYFNQLINQISKTTFCS